MTDPAAAPLQLTKGTVKQVLSGDSIVVRGQPVNGPPPEKQINFSKVLAPKLARRPTGPAGSNETQDEPYAWEAREFLRRLLVGKEVYFTCELPPNSSRYYGTVYLGADANTAPNVTEMLIAEGLCSVRRDAPDVEKYSALEDQAKSSGKGKWSTTGNAQDHVRNVKWSQENPRAVLEQKNGKPVKAIIEYVRDGSTVRAFLLPDFYYVTLMISGIRCPGFKLDSEGKPDPSIQVPYAEEARYFVESNFLQRDVEIILDSVNNNNFVGTIRTSEGNVAECLLRTGFGKCVDWSMAFMKTGAEKLRAAEKYAKENRLRLWKDYKSNVQVFTGKEKEFTGTVVEIYYGDAISVKVPQGGTKKVFLSSIRAPREANRTADEDGKLPPRPKNFRPLFDIPWMFEAREYLRKELIGKKVHCTLDYISPARDNMAEKNCYTVTINGKNVAQGLVSKGFAHVVRHRQDDDQRSSQYDTLMAAEAEASSGQKGVHSKKAPVHRFNDLTIDHSRIKTQYLPSWQRALKTDGVIEFVASGSRFRMLIPKDSVVVSFLLAGISCPRASRAAGAGGGQGQEGEPYGDDAMEFTRDRILHRNVSVHIDSTDKAGASVIGWLWTENNVNLSVALVEEGYATVHFSAEKTEYYRALKQAEDKAKAKRKRVWTNYVEPKPEEEKENSHKERNKADVIDTDGTAGEKERPKIKYDQVVVTEVTSELHFYAQTVDKGPALEALMGKLRQEMTSSPPLAGAYAPKKGDMCVAKFSEDNEWYRAKIERVQGKNVTVFYLDYGNKETIDSSRVASIPASYRTEPAYTTEYGLALVTLPPDEEDKAEAVKVFAEDVLNRNMLMHVEYESDRKYVTLVDPTSQADIAEGLIKDGYVMATLSIKNPKVRALKNTYIEAETEAKKEHRGIWVYGDVGVDDTPEFGIKK